MNIKYKLLDEHLTLDEYKTLPDDARNLWLTRPARQNIEQVRLGMYFRVFLLAVTTIYYKSKYGDFGEHLPLLVFLFGYEFAYYTLRKKNEERDYQELRFSYMEKVDNLIAGLPSDES